MSTATKATPSTNGSITVAKLAAEKALPIEFLQSLGLHDLTGGGVGMPYRGTRGDVLFTRERESPRRKGRFYQPAGTPLRPYGLDRLEAVREAKHLYLVEGESDCWALWYHGLPALGIPGSNSARTLTPDCLEGVETVYVHQEPDHAGEAFLKGVATRVIQVGYRGRVFVWRCPAGVKDSADLHVREPEWFMARVEEAIKASVLLAVTRQSSGRNDHTKTSAAPAAALAERASGVNEAEDDPHRLARLFLEDHRHPDGPTLRYWREEYHGWDGTAWRPLADQELRAEVCQSVKREFDRLNGLAVQKWAAVGDKPPPVARKVTARLTADTLHALAGLTLLRGTVSQPSWLDGQVAPPFSAEDALACRNGLVSLAQVANGASRLYPHTPRLFSANALDFDFNAAAPIPNEWLGFLGKVWPEDQQAIDTLQEMFGYFLTPDTRQQKILMPVGPKRSGKGTIARVLTRLVGPANVCNPTLASLGTNFGLSPLLGKSLAIISDARLSGRTDAAVVIERLLSISGEDAQTIDRKHLKHVTTKLGVRFVILTNELPKLHDPSGALAGRLILLRLTRSWYGQEDTGLTERLLGELPGILLWSIKGLQRLRARGYFVQPESSRRLLADMEDLSSPVGAFVKECCEVGPHCEILVRDLFERWKQWGEEKGRKEHGTEQTFGRDLRAAVPQLEVRQPRSGEGRVRVYEGIRLRAEEEAIPD
jgi:putative DNA primase/helicase